MSANVKQWNDRKRTWAFALLFDQRQFVSVAVGALQEERGAAALEFPVWDDGNAISEEVGFVHVVGGQQDGASCNTT